MRNATVVETPGPRAMTDIGTRLIGAGSGAGWSCKTAQFDAGRCASQLRCKLIIYMNLCAKSGLGARAHRTVHFGQFTIMSPLL